MDAGVSWKRGVRTARAMAMAGGAGEAARRDGPVFIRGGAGAVVDRES
uniref:Uncharacterized protein n=1 Tax=Arundo donax TaxID=35708 RepID=A0A0A9EZT0_ARUDO